MNKIATGAINKSIFKWQLLNPLANFDQTWQECCLGDSLPKQIKWLYSNEQDGAERKPENL